MGNHRFKLSDMMPNAWFYKLRDMSKVRSHNPSHSIKKSMQSSTPNPTKPLYYTTDPIRMDNKLCISPKFFDPPRKSSKKRSKRKTIYMPSPRKIAPSQSAQIPVWLEPSSVDDYSDRGAEYFPESPLSGFHQSNMSSCSCNLSCSATDIIINVDDTSYDFDMISEPDLPPIQTKPGKHVDVSLEESIISNNDTPIKFSAEKLKRDRRSPGGRKSFSGGVKIGRKPGRRRKSVKEDQNKGVLFYSESFAIVKASFDPEKDFRESMMEMIVENDIKAPKDLEDLLASYLSLNSVHYHHLIIKAFEQIWFTIN